jgi:hypothetical protein
MNKLTIIFLALVLVTSCGKLPTEFSIPSWETDLYLPIIAKQFTLDTLINESDNIVLDNSGEYPVLKIVIDTLIQKYAAKDLIDDVLKSESFSLSFPGVSGEKAFNVPFAKNVLIDSAYFSKGELYIALTNNTAGNLNYSIEIPGLRTPQWQAFTVAGDLTKNQKYETTVNLSSYSYSSKAVSNIKDAIKFVVKSDCDNESGTITFGSELKNTAIDYFSGAVTSGSPKSIDETTNTNISDNIKRIAKGITFTDPLLELDVNYKSVGGDFYDILLDNTKLSVENSAGAKLNIAGKGGNDPLDNIFVQNGKYRLKLDNTNSNFADAIKLLPNIMNLKSMVTLNPNMESGKIRKNDTLTIKGLITLGSKLHIDSLKVLDTIAIDLPQETRDLIKSAIWAKIYLYAQNGLPFVCSVNINFTDVNYKSLFSKSIELVPAAYQNQLSQVSITNDTLDLTVSEMPLLADARFMLVEIFIDSNFDTNASYTLRPEDFVKVKAKCRVKYNVKL